MYQEGDEEKGVGIVPMSFFLLVDQMEQALSE